jgi:magnesium transporter
MDDNLTRDLESIIQDRDFSALRSTLDSWSPADLASLLVRLPVEDQVIVFRSLPRKTASTVFHYLNTHAREPS